MFKFIRQAIGGAALASVALLPVAHADTITFDDLAATAFGDQESIVSGGFRFTMGGNFGQVDTAGGFAAAPIGNSSQFLGSMNSSQVLMTNDSGRFFSLQTLDYGFLADGVTRYAAGDDPGALIIQGWDVDGNYAGYNGLSWGGADALGQFSFGDFGAANMGSLAGVRLSAVSFLACTFVGSSCNWPVGNVGQFAMDNIQVEVPEPGTIALMAIGLLAIGARRRSHR